MSTVKDLALTVRSLATAATQLKVAIEIDAQGLAEELRPYTSDFETLQVAAKSIVVDSEESNQKCLDMMNQMWAKQKGFESVWSRYKTPLNQARKAVLDLESQTAGAAEATKKLLQAKSAAFLRACQQAKAEAEKKMAALANRERGRLEREAEDLMMDGNVRGAQAKIQEAHMIVAPELPDAMPTVTGARVTPKYRGEVVDVVAVLRAIVDGKLPLMHEVRGDMRPLVTIDQTVLNALVSRLGPGLRIPGIKVEDDVQVAAGGRR